jgi:ABC-2 type transport system permease protein
LTGIRLFFHQLRYDQKLFWRNPASVFFSVVLPLIFLLLLGAVFGGDGGLDKKYGLKADEYLVPAIMTLGIVSATFVNTAMTITFQREAGVLKRMRGTPLPTPVFVATRTTSAVINAAIIAAIILAAGALVYGVDINAQRLLAVAVFTIFGAAAFCGLGFAWTIIVPNEGAATAMTNAAVLPLYFISGVFGSADDLPKALAEIGRFFPVQHLGAGLFHAFSPNATGTGLSGGDLLNVMIWGIFGLVLAARYFRWTPRRD